MILYCVIFTGLLCTIEAVHHPILLMPGWGGSQLFAKYIKRPEGPPCNAINKSFEVWINPIYFLPETLDCLVSLLKLEYNKSNRSTYSPKYVKVEASGFGSIDTIKFLSKFNFSLTSYFYNIVDLLTSSYNYTANVNIRGAPYDFRKAPNEMKTYFSDVKSLIEKMYADANGTSLIIIGHSLGNLLTQEFFNRISQNWKDKYIRSFISISAPYSGSLITLQGILSGFSGTHDFLNHIKLRKMEKSFPSFYYMIPNSKLWPNVPLVLTNRQNFTAKNMNEIFTLSKLENAIDHFKDQEKYMTNRISPKVETHCIYGVGLKTPLTLDYRQKQFPDMLPDIIYTDGDGTVPTHSMMICPQWKHQQSQLVTLNTFSGVSHRDILKNDNVLKQIGNIIKNINK